MLQVVQMAQQGCRSSRLFDDLRKAARFCHKTTYLSRALSGIQGALRHAACVIEFLQRNCGLAKWPTSPASALIRQHSFQSAREVAG